MLTKMAIAVFVVVGVTALQAPASARNWPTAYEASRAGISVALLPSPQSLRGRIVYDTYGRPIGRVVSIDVDREGKAEVVNIEVGGLLNIGTRVMPFAADRIVYFPTQAKLVASNDPSPVSAPPVDSNSPTRASVKRPAPSLTIIRN